MNDDDEFLKALDAKADALMAEENDDFQPGGDAGLEALGRRHPSRGIGSATKAVFNVLYEVEAPLDLDELAGRSFTRVHPAVHYHAQRAHIRQLNRNARGVIHHAQSLSRSWRWYIGIQIRGAVKVGTLIRLGDRYEPNPNKPPRVERLDGSLMSYTRDAWARASVEDRTTGEIQTMRMEADRLLGDLNLPELQVALELALLTYAGWDRQGKRPVEPRGVRAQLRWLLERPTTDESRAWLLHELVRRAYNKSGDAS